MWYPSAAFFLPVYGGCPCASSWDISQPQINFQPRLILLLVHPEIFMRRNFSRFDRDQIASVFLDDRS
jgi:hypothetical protein